MNPIKYSSKTRHSTDKRPVHDHKWRPSKVQDINIQKPATVLILHSLPQGCITLMRQTPSESAFVQTDDIHDIQATSPSNYICFRMTEYEDLSPIMNTLAIGNQRRIVYYHCTRCCSAASPRCIYHRQQILTFVNEEIEQLPRAPQNIPYQRRWFFNSLSHYSQSAV